ncbi:protein angel homolog 2 isoform X2 [Solea solea]|uniref:protein angel homolog 2 isoform X2 n=1 Tax=Solea solea TaxID=90069 RepID=UPI00272C21EE|nr:protein angel homolog 2 isoform X2 [Solea solea]
MFPNRNISDISPNIRGNPSMFRHWLNSSGSSFLLRVCPSLIRAGFRSSSTSSASSSFPFLPRFTPTPHPWRSRPPPPHPYFSGRALHSSNISRGNFGRSWRSLYTSPGLLMERHDRDREPPHKRRKNEEEKRGGKVKGGTSWTEHRRSDPSVDISPRHNLHFRDGARGRGRSDGVRWENSREKDVERTKSESKDRQRKDGSSHDGQWRSKRQQDGHTDSQATTQIPKSRPESDKGPTHKPRPNAWFKEEQGQCDRKTTAPQEPQRNRSSGHSPRMKLHPQPCSVTHHPNLWQEAGANREPPPPGTYTTTLQRHWEAPPSCSTRRQPADGSTAFDFSVMSYNILSQDLLQDNAYLYRHCDPAVLPWEHRLPNLLSEIQQHDADILCLQEVQEGHYENQIKPALQTLGYQCEYKKRTGSKPDGCAVVFKSSRLSLVSANPVEFFRCGDALLDRDNVGLVLLLRPNGAAPSTASICVANTHLLYNPRRGDVKLAQLAVLLAEVGRLSRRPDGSTDPVLLCGDFNSTPWSPLYCFLTTGFLDYRGLQIGMVSGQEVVPKGHRLVPCPIWSQSLGINTRCQYEERETAESSSSCPSGTLAVEGAISNLTVEDVASKPAAAFNRKRIEHSLKLQSSYRHHLMPGGRPEITTCHSRTAMTVDYILFTPDFLAPPTSSPGDRGLQLLGRLSLVGQSDLEEVNGLPNRRHSSDHLPLLARFRLRL